MVLRISRWCIGLFFLLFVSFDTTFAEHTKNTIAEHTFDFETIYDTMRKALNSSYAAQENLAKSYVGKLLGTSAENVSIMMNEDPNTCGNKCLLQQYCPNNHTIQSMLKCKEQVIFEVTRRKTSLVKENQMHKQTLASQAFLNGTLQDTGNKTYDIIVDLNIVDLLFFGDKMSRPTNGSPFLPKNESGTGNLFGEPFVSDSLSLSSSSSAALSSASPIPTFRSRSRSGSFSSSSSSLASISPTPSVSRFCMAFDAVNPVKITTLTNIDTLTNGDSSENTSGDTSNNIVADTSGSFGNFFDEQYKYQGGTYPDVKKWQKKKKCKEGEKSFFYGRICIPEFCNELICIKIDMKMQTKAKRLSSLNCTECHIDRGLAALNMMMGTLGQNTPNSNSMEPYFLRAIANLFKNVTSRITIASKPLPFLVYDEALIADKNESEKPEEQKQKEKADARKKEISEKNNQLYTDIVLECPEMIEHFSQTQTSTEQLLEYCKKVDAERMDISLVQQLRQEVVTTKNVQNSIAHEKVVKPFYEQMAQKIVTINALLQSISPEEIAKTKQHCKSTLSQ